MLLIGRCNEIDIGKLPGIDSTLFICNTPFNIMGLNNKLFSTQRIELISFTEYRIPAT